MHSLHSLLDAQPRAAAVFACSDLQGIGTLRACAERGVSVPRDVAILSFDGTTEAECTTPPLSVIRQPLDQIAARAFEALAHGMAHAPVIHALVAHTFVPRVLRLPAVHLPVEVSGSANPLQAASGGGPRKSGHAADLEHCLGLPESGAPGARHGRIDGTRQAWPVSLSPTRSGCDRDGKLTLRVDGNSITSASAATTPGPTS
jgi:hypothetical protein